MATRWLGRPAARITLASMAVAAAACTALTVPAWADPGQTADAAGQTADAAGQTADAAGQAAEFLGQGREEPREASDVKILDQDKDGNEVRMKIFSPTMNRELPLTVLLPRDYSDGKSYPVLYALPGAGEGDDRMWADKTDIKSFAARNGALIVLAPTEHGGFYSDWYDGSRKWETFHTRELPGLIKDEFNGSGKQAIMGISLGGFASIKYAAHNPGQYAAAAAMSSVLVSSSPGTVPLYQVAMRINDQNPLNIWGDPIAAHAKWRYEDPSEHVTGLRDTNVFVSSATGLPTFNGSTGDGKPLERVKALVESPTDAKDHAAAVALEQPAFDTTVLFARKASEAGVNVTTSYPLRGVHNWGLWNDEYKAAWSQVIAPSLGLPS